jgi:hypothetical protein
VQPAGGQVTFTETGQLGLYRVRWGDEGQASFTVNLFSAGESDVEPADALPGLSLSETGGEAAPQEAKREWWRPVAMLSLALLTGEWLVYQRSALARLRAGAARAFRSTAQRLRGQP